MDYGFIVIAFGGILVDEDTIDVSVKVLNEFPRDGRFSFQMHHLVGA